VLRTPPSATDRASLSGPGYRVRARSKPGRPRTAYRSAARGRAGSGGHGARARGERGRNEPAGVRLAPAIDGATVLETVDRTPGRLRLPGGTGLRADNSELGFRDSTVTPV
jgi:hypothetical protein